MPGSAYSFKLIKLCVLGTARVSFFKQAPVLALPTLSVFAENTTFRRDMQFLTLCLIICNILVLHLQRVGFTLWEMQTTLKRWRKLLCSVRWQPHSTANLEDPESWKCLTHRRYHHAHLHIYLCYGCIWICNHYTVRASSRYRFPRIADFSGTSPPSLPYTWLFPMPQIGKRRQLHGDHLSALLVSYWMLYITAMNINSWKIMFAKPNKHKACHSEFPWATGQIFSAPSKFHVIKADDTELCKRKKRGVGPIGRSLGDWQHVPKWECRTCFFRFFFYFFAMRWAVPLCRVPP